MTSELIKVLVMFMFALAHAAVLEGWRKRIAERQLALLEDPDPAKDVRITMVVPVRNGGSTLVPLLQDLYSQRYPKELCEVIVVDDGSADRTVEHVNGLMRTWPQLKLVALDNEQGKKAAITRGVELATSELILLTDADARCHPDRILALVQHQQVHDHSMVLMPVWDGGNGSILGRLQREEQCALQAATAGSAMEGNPILANGANLAFSKKRFMEVGGYQGDKWASGDDMFLMKKFKKNGSSIGYLLDRRAVVEVEPEMTWQAFIQQRLRWSGKMRSYGASSNKLTGLLVLLFPWALVALTIHVTRNVNIGESAFYTALILIGAWLLWLFPILRLTQEMNLFFTRGDVFSNGSERTSRRSFFRPLLALMAFTVYAPLITVASLFIRPVWKGRRV